jgi:hypothetical protein
MASEDVARVHREAIVVEGHRDMFEMNYLAAKGQKYPVLNVTLPRLKRANISTTFYAISGDSLTHANGTYRFLHAALQNIDALRAEMAASQGQMKLILHHEDLPAAPTPDTVHFVRASREASRWKGASKICATSTASACGRCRSPGICVTSSPTVSRRSGRAAA